MKFAISACENIFGGHHGMNRNFMIEGDEEDARQAAEEASLEVMDSYSDVGNQLEEQAIFEFGPDFTDDDMEELRLENMSFVYSKIKNSCPFSNQKIDKMLYNDYEGFVEEWGDKDFKTEEDDIDEEDELEEDEESDEDSDDELNGVCADCGAAMHISDDPEEENYCSKCLPENNDEDSARTEFRHAVKRLMEEGFNPQVELQEVLYGFSE